MGVIKLTFLMIFYTLVVVLVLMVVPGIPPNYKFEAYSIRPPRKMEGKLTPNDILDRAELVIEGQFIGPESVAIRGDDVFTGVEGGGIIKVDINGKWKRVAKIGGDCHGNYKNPCSRPLGMRFAKDGKLIVADAYEGILEVNVDTGSVKVLLARSTLIDGKPFNFADDLDIDSQGRIYVSDLSQTCTMENFLPEALSEATGRLVRFDPKTKKTETLINGIHAANGVQISRKEDFVVVSETFRSRLLKYHLKGPKQGTHEVMCEGLPGLPDNIRSNGKGGFYVSLVMADTEETPSFFRKIMPIPSVRKLVLRVQFIMHKIIELIDNFLPNDLLKAAHTYVSHFGPIGDYTNGPKKVIILDVDETGNIIGSLQTKNGKMTGISEVGLGEKYTYFGSPYTDKLWRIKTEYIV